MCLVEVFTERRPISTLQRGVQGAGTERPHGTLENCVKSGPSGTAQAQVRSPCEKEAGRPRTCQRLGAQQGWSWPSGSASECQTLGGGPPEEHNTQEGPRGTELMRLGVQKHTGQCSHGALPCTETPELKASSLPEGPRAWGGDGLLPAVRAERGSQPGGVSISNSTSSPEFSSLWSGNPAPLLAVLHVPPPPPVLGLGLPC